MTEVEAVQSTIVRITHHIDHKRWTDLRALFADELDVDYTALLGGSPQRAAADDLIGGWREKLARAVTQHLLGPIDVAVTGTTAHASCHVRAYHLVAGKPGGDEWTVMGHYLFELARSDRWSITAMTLEVIQQLGNPTLLA